MAFSIFGNKKSPEEKFWEWFGYKAEEFYQFETNQQALTEELRDRLRTVDSHLVWQMSVLQRDGKRSLEISADGMKEYIPVVLRLLEKAPRLPKWNFFAFRQRCPGVNVDFEGTKISEDDIYFEGIDEGEKTGVILHVRRYDRSKHMIGAVFILLDSLLGEYDVMTRIGSLEFKTLNEEERTDLKPLKELPKLIDSKKTRH